MSDLRTLLHEAANAVPVAAATATVDDDLARGRLALARGRRIRWTVVPTGLVAAAAAGLLIVGPEFAAQPSPGVAVIGPSSGGPVNSGPVNSADLSAKISLVGFTGTQPAGYTIDRVPEGWEIQNIDKYSLVIAPVDATDKDPNSFVGKILVGRANDGEVSVHRDQVREIAVGKVTARLFTFPEPQVPAGSRPATDDKHTQGLLLPVGKGAYLIFQLPGRLHWDAATVAAFAAGVHMNPGAQAAAG